MSTYIIDIRRSGPRGPYERPLHLPPGWGTVDAENDEEALAYASRLTRFRRRLVRVGDFAILRKTGGDYYTVLMRKPSVYMRTRDGFSRVEEP